ncbi:metallophosphoesterase family protein [Morganella morganii]|uniref:metallophosphoesterase family protein n=1 Tax=Morganella morganii TaxID=582 RepID=UPI002368664B|nr:metallophosphoesterase [Morganella morganii]
MKQVKILVISDLHVGQSARGDDFCTDGNTSGINSKDYVSDFRVFVKENNVEATHLLIAGDISNRADYKEIDLAAERIKNITEILKIPDNNIYFVPGNHDSNWQDEKYAIEQGLPHDKVVEKKFWNIMNHEYFKNIHDNASFKSYYQSPYTSIWESDDIIAVGINSSVFDVYDKKPHHGEVRNEFLREVTSELKKLPNDSRKIKILFTHHHPKNYSDTTFEDPDFSQMKNSEDFLNFAFVNEFDFLVHGHKHIPRFNIHSDINNIPIVTLCAGSFSASLKEYHNGVANFFHIIEVDKICDNIDSVCGKIKSWSYFLSKKWMEADFLRDSISHEEYFGAFMNRKILRRDLESKICELFENTNSIRWSTLSSELKDLEYCNRRVLFGLLNDISESNGFEVMFGKDNNPTLLKD